MALICKTKYYLDRHEPRKVKRDVKIKKDDLITNLDIIGVCRQLETASKWNRGRGGREKAAFAVNLRTIR